MRLLKGPAAYMKSVQDFWKLNEFAEASMIYRNPEKGLGSMAAGSVSQLCTIIPQILWYTINWVTESYRYAVLQWFCYTQWFTGLHKGVILS